MTIGSPKLSIIARLSASAAASSSARFSSSRVLRASAFECWLSGDDLRAGFDGARLVAARSGLTDLRGGFFFTNGQSQSVRAGVILARRLERRQANKGLFFRCEQYTEGRRYATFDCGQERQ